MELETKTRLHGRWEVECYSPDGSLKWADKIDNLVVNAGLDHLLDATLVAGTQITTWYVGLKNTGTAVAADTMGSHGSWTEFTAYDEATRQTCTFAAVSSQSTTNSASKAVFTISTNSSTIYGMFLTNNSTKSGTTGTLFSVGDFDSAKSADDDDVLNVTYTVSAADDGA